MKNTFSHIILTWFPAVVVFFLVPFSLYIPNQEEFKYSFVILTPYLILFAFSLAFLIVIYNLWPILIKKVAFAFFYLGVFLSVSDIVAPLRVGEIMVGWDASPIPEPSLYIFLEVAAAVIILALAYIIPKHFVLSFAPNFIMLFLIIQVVFILKDLDKPINTNTIISEGIYQPKEAIAKGNIYHITFDAFSSYRFLELLKEEHSEDDFDGFVFFPNNKSNYLFTWISRASYMTGNIYRKDSLENWMNEWKIIIDS